MSSTTIFQRAWRLGAAAVLLAATAHAQPADKRTYFTFNRPIALPGVTLPAGKYLFRLADDQTSRKVIQVVSADGTKPYAMLFTIPDERRDAPKDAEVAFLETPARTPSAVKSWWYPGERIGYEFIYPREQARRLARETGASVLTTKSETSKADETRSAELGRIDAGGRDQDVPQRTPPQAPQVAQQPSAPPPSVSKNEVPNPRPVARNALPRTASQLPLVGLIGLIAVVGFSSLRLWRTTH